MDAFEIGLLLMTATLCVVGLLIGWGWFRTMSAAASAEPGRSNDERAAKLLNEIADNADPGETLIVRVGDVVVQTTIPVGDDEELPF